MSDHSLPENVQWLDGSEMDVDALTRPAYAVEASTPYDELSLGIAKPAHRDWMVACWRDQFGYYGDRPEQIVDACLDQENYDWWGFVVGTDDGLAAFAVMHWFSIEDASAYFAGVDTSGWPFAVRNASVFMACVADAWKHHGLATALVERIHRYVRKADARRVFATCWHREEHVDSRQLVKSLGYRQVGHDPEQYVAADGDRPRECPDCGTGCECEASFWTIALGDYEGDR